jgi:putative hydrolase of the HAD superfamily
MKDNINWKSIKTILLDMDGTLLDLHFDNYFWQEYLPIHWGELNNMGAEDAKAQLKDWYSKEAGTLSWYCLDFWTDRLKFNVLDLKADVEHLIQYRPHAELFLEQLRVNPMYSVIMVTNAHEDLIKMKVDKTGIDVFFDRIISSHAIGHAKEEQYFWRKLHLENPFNPDETLLIDDNLSVLRAAREFGIKNLLTISKPDSQNEHQDPEEFQAINSFIDINF